MASDFPGKSVLAQLTAKCYKLMLLSRFYGFMEEVKIYDLLFQYFSRQGMKVCVYQTSDKYSQIKMQSKKEGV